MPRERRREEIVDGKRDAGNVPRLSGDHVLGRCRAWDVGEAGFYGAEEVLGGASERRRPCSSLC